MLVTHRLLIDTLPLSQQVTEQFSGTSTVLVQKGPTPSYHSPNYLLHRIHHSAIQAETQMQYRKSGNLKPHVPSCMHHLKRKDDTSDCTITPTIFTNYSLPCSLPQHPELHVVLTRSALFTQDNRKRQAMPETWCRTVQQCPSHTYQ